MSETPNFIRSFYQNNQEKSSDSYPFIRSVNLSFFPGQFRLLSLHRGSSFLLTYSTPFLSSQLLYSSAHIWSVQTPFYFIQAVTSLLTDYQFRLLCFHQESYFSAHIWSVQTPFLSSRELLLCSHMVSSGSFYFIRDVTPLLRKLHPWPAEIFGKNRKMGFFCLVSKFNFRSPVWQIFTIFSACFIYGIFNTHTKFEVSKSQTVVTREWSRQGSKFIYLQNLRSKFYLTKIFLQNSFWTHIASTMFWQFILSP